MRLHEAPRSGTEKGVAGLVAMLGVGLCLHHDPGAAIPAEHRPHQLAGAARRVAEEKASLQQRPRLHPTLLTLPLDPVRRSGVSGPTLLAGTPHPVRRLGGNAFHRPVEWSILK